MLLIFCIVISIVLAKLKIVQPSQFVSEIEYEAIQFDSDMTIQGLLRIIQKDIKCKEIQSSHLESGDIVITTCTNIEQLNVFKNLNVSLIMVMDNNLDFDTSNFDNQIVRISVTNGEAIVNYLIEQQSKTLKEQKPSIFAKIKPDVQNMNIQGTQEIKVVKQTQEIKRIEENNLNKLKKTQDIIVDLGLIINDPKSYEIIRQFQQYHQSLVEKGVIFYIYYPILPCYTCEQRHQFNQIEKHCYGGGRYCQFSEELAKLTGQSILDEYIRQSCLFNKNQTAWFNYMQVYGKLCQNQIQLDRCSLDAFNKSNQSISIINDCVGNSFINNDTPKELQQNMILKNQQSYGFNQSSPRIQINGVTQKYTQFKEIVDVLCIQLKSDPPEYCSSFSKMNKIMKTNKLEIIFFILLIGLIGILVVMMLVQIYRKFKSTTSYNQLQTDQIQDQGNDIEMNSDNL